MVGSSFFMPILRPVFKIPLKTIDDAKFKDSIERQAASLALAFI